MSLVSIANWPLVRHFGRLLFRSILRGSLRGASSIALAGLPGQLFGLFALVVAHNIRPELDDFRAHDSFRGHRQSIIDRVAYSVF
jgi:hypothetical protein